MTGGVPPYRWRIAPSRRWLVPLVALFMALGPLLSPAAVAQQSGKSISELQQVYEAVWGVHLDPRNFYRKVQNARGFIVADGPTRRTENGRPARLFRAGPNHVLYPPMVRSAHIVTESEGRARR